MKTESQVRKLLAQRIKVMRHRKACHGQCLCPSCFGAEVFVGVLQLVLEEHPEQLRIEEQSAAQAKQLEDL